MTVSRTLAPAFALLAVAGCTVGPDFTAPRPAAPADWSSWRSGAPSLAGTAATDGAMPPQWWTLLGDPVLDRLESEALAASPDVETAALHYAQARVQLGAAGAAGLPQINFSADATRTRISEHGASTRLFDALAPDRDALAAFLARPYTLYSGGFDAAWELDLWGKVRRSIEQAGALASQQQALLDQARLSVASEVARAYFDLRTVQRQVVLTREDIALSRERTALVSARVAGGLEDSSVLEREQAGLNGLEASLPGLEAGEAMQLNRIALLLGRRPGDLAEDLRRPAPAGDGEAPLPDLSLGLPSQVALARPDLRAAEAQVHVATAAIGVATADLYPSIRLGGGFNLESYRRETLFDWASRSWAIGPSISLPLFDGGRRRAVVQLRKLEAREAVVEYQRTVLRAWQEIDDALSGYTADRQQRDKLSARVRNTGDALQLLEARYRAGAVNYLPIIDARRAYLQAQRDLSDVEGRLRTRFAAINKAIGNVPSMK